MLAVPVRARPGISLVKILQENFIYFFFTTLALLTLFSFWIEGACSTMCLVSSNSQISEI